MTKKQVRLALTRINRCFLNSTKITGLTVGWFKVYKRIKRLMIFLSYLVQDSDSNVMLVVVLHEFLLIQILLSSGGVKAELCEILVWWFKTCCDWRHKAFATRFGRTAENGFKAFYTFKGRHLLAKPWYWAHDQTVNQTSCQRKWAQLFLRFW